MLNCIMVHYRREVREETRISSLREGKSGIVVCTSSLELGLGYRIS